MPTAFTHNFTDWFFFLPGILNFLILSCPSLKRTSFGLSFRIGQKIKNFLVSFFLTCLNFPFTAKENFCEIKNSALTFLLFQKLKMSCYLFRFLWVFMTNLLSFKLFCFLLLLTDNTSFLLWLLSSVSLQL